MLAPSLRPPSGAILDHAAWAATWKQLACQVYPSQEALGQEKSRLEALLAAEQGRQHAATAEGATAGAPEDAAPAAAAADPLDAYMTNLGTQMESDKVLPACR